MRSQARTSTAGPAPLVGLTLAALFAASALLPYTPLVGRTVCPFFHLTGLPCAGCGLGRSFVAITAGDLGAALFAHPLGPVVYVALAAAMVLDLLGWARGRPVVRALPRPWTRPLVAATVLCFGAVWVARLTSVLPGP